MKSLGTTALLALGIAAVIAACGTDDGKLASGTGGSAAFSGELPGGAGGVPPDPRPFCTKICQLEAAVDCSTGVAVPVDGELAVPVDDPYCLTTWCDNNVLVAEFTPMVRVCQREWDAYIECLAKIPPEDWGCYMGEHNTIDPFLCDFPELEDYNACINSGGSTPYQPGE